jgi:hypothetical protein
MRDAPYGSRSLFRSRRSAACRRRIIRRGRSAGSSGSRRADRPTSWCASWASGCRRASASRCWWNAPPDGYTLGSVTSANAINATVNKRTLGFDYLKQLAPVAGMSQGPSVMVVNPAVPAKSVAEFVAYAKANPGKLNMGTPGVGSTGHLAGELFKATAGPP